jgi:broad specificity phosphatase PhoE
MLLIRHAQSEWNLHFSRTRVDPGLPDPSLTAEGVRQAEAAADELRSAGIRRLVASPYRRALQTATIIGERLGLAITVEPLVRERCAFSCDQGRPAAELVRDWPALDMSGLDEIWWGGLIESHASLNDRCDRFRERAAGWGDDEQVGVVSHWGFIRALTGQMLGNIGTVRFRPDEPLKPLVELRL